MVEFSSAQAKEIRKLLARPPETTGAGAAEGFLLRYVFLEALVRTVGRYYRNRQTQKKTSTVSDESLNIDVVRRSFEYFGILVHQERLALLLDSKMTKRKSKSARQLRNGLVHRWDVNDSREVSERHEALEMAIAGTIEAVTVRVKGSER